MYMHVFILDYGYFTIVINYNKRFGFGLPAFKRSGLEGNEDVSS